MANVKDEALVLSVPEKRIIAFALGLALASKKRALNAPTTSDDMKGVIQKEMADVQAVWLKVQ